MITVQRRAMRGIGALCTIGLLLSLLALSGHRHNGDPSHPSDACARCVATHFSPGTTAPPAPHLVPPVASAASAVLDLAPLASPCQPRPSGRAPPTSISFGAV